MEKLILCIQFVRYGAVKHHSPRLAGKSDKSFIHDVNQHKRTLSQRRNRFLQVAPAMPGICGKQESGGARRDRTDDLKLAKLPLSQLSYGPRQRQGFGVAPPGLPSRSCEAAKAGGPGKS